MSPEWLAAYCAAATIAIGLIASLWKFSRSIDNMRYILETVVKTQTEHQDDIKELKKDVHTLNVNVAFLNGRREGPGYDSTIQ